METLGIIHWQRSGDDERKVIVELTPKGKLMEPEASTIPERMAAGIISSTMKIEELIDLKNKPESIIHTLTEKDRIE